MLRGGNSSEKNNNHELKEKKYILKRTEQKHTNKKINSIENE